MADKVRSLQEVVASIPDGANLTSRGFAAHFTALALVRELIRQGKRELEMASLSRPA